MVGMTRWEYEALEGLYGEEAKEKAKRSWGGYLGFCLFGFSAMLVLILLGLIFLIIRFAFF